MGYLAGKVVVITGAGRGLGRSHALLCAAHGARVVVNDLGVAFDGAREDGSPAHAVVDEIKRTGGQAVADLSDVASWDGCRQLLETTLTMFGRADVLVLNAAITRPRKFHELSESDWNDQVRVNLGGTVFPARAFSAHWVAKSHGGESVDASIICTTSKVGLRGTPLYLAYGCTKAAVAYFVGAAAAELAPHGIRVNGIAPRAITRMMQDATRNLIEVAGQEGIEAILRAVKSPPPWDALGPDSVSPTVVWLASDQSKPVTGVILNVDGARIAVQEGWRDGSVGTVQAGHTVEDIHRIVLPLLNLPAREGG
jgi:NAD(P)-dependent dehydrogenase (short-subunit alcohol dehydrogenase family)